MAFVPLYGLNTTLTAATAAGAGQLQIDNSIAAALAVQLGVGNTSFIQLSDGVNFEIARIDSITAPFLNVTRGRDNTTSSAFPIGTCLRFVWEATGIAAVSAGPSIVLTGTGALTATQTSPGNWTLNVPVPVITATAPIEVLGAYPAWEIDLLATLGGCCCSGSSSGGGSGSPITIGGTGLANVTGVDPSFNVGVLPPNFIASGPITITGTWPNITFTVTGGSPSGVNSVTGSAKILVAGSPTDPIIQLKTTGVVAGTFNGVTFDAYGTITGIDPTYVPLVELVSGSAPTLAITVAPGPNQRTLTVTSGAIGVEGTIALALATAAGSRNSIDVSTAVTPKGLDAVLNAYVPPGTAVVTVLNSSSYTPDIPANYTNTIAGVTITTPVLATGDSLVIDALVEAVDTATPGVPPTWGFGVFHGLAIVQAITPIVTGSHKIQFVIAGPQPAQSLILKTTALTGTTNIVAQSLTGTFLPGP